MSIGGITRLLNEQGVPTRKQISRWERSTVWAMLRNPAYKGAACFGKTRSAPRQRVTRPLRLRGGIGTRNSAHHERSRDDWIAIAVPAIIAEETFARAQELLEQNKIHARRRTIRPSVVQGLVSCSKCGYALSRTSTRSSARTIHYYRCIGSDAWRRLGGPVCDNRPVRQDLLDQVVWTEVVRLLQDPSLIQNELDRRLAAARTAQPTKQRERALLRDLARTRKSIDRLLTAYQEDLLSLDELRQRMPELRHREHAMQAELQSIVNQVDDRAAYLRLAETISAFLTRLRTSADSLDVQDRQRIVRLVVKEILVGDDAITIRHAIPIPPGPPNDTPPSPRSTRSPTDQSYLLRSGRQNAALRRSRLGAHERTFAENSCFQERSDKSTHLPVGDPPSQAVHQMMVVDVIEAALDVAFDDPLIGWARPTLYGLLAGWADRVADMLQSVTTRFLRPKAVRNGKKLRFVDWLKHLQDRGLHDPILDGRNSQRPELARFSGLWDHQPPDG